MIKVIVRANGAPKEIVAKLSDTPLTVFNELGMDTAGSVVSLNGRFLSSAEKSMSFETLEVSEGRTINLSSIVKADGANK